MADINVEALKKILTGKKNPFSDLFGAITGEQQFGANTGLGQYGYLLLSLFQNLTDTIKLPTIQPTSTNITSLVLNKAVSDAENAKKLTEAITSSSLLMGLSNPSLLVNLPAGTDLNSDTGIDTNYLNTALSNLSDEAGGLSKIEAKAEKQAKLAKGAGIAGAAGDLLNSFLPEKQEYSGQKGAITAGLDSAYDQLADAANKFGPVGNIVSGFMKANAGLGKVANLTGAGTDAMTVQDAIFGSNFLGPLGWVNGWGGRTTSTITKDNEAFAQVGSSYGGTENTVDEALEVSGKKYGLLSNSARRKAERQLAEARRLQSIIQGISDDAQIRSILQGTMSDVLSNRYGLLLQGGYNLSAIHVGKRGLKVSPYKAKRLTSNITFKFLPKEVEKEQQGTKIASHIEPADLNLIITTFKEGGIIPSKVETIIEPVLIITEIAPLGLELIPQFLKGGPINNNILEYFGNPDLSSIKLKKSKKPRTEGNTIYYNNDEDLIHELTHYLTQNQPNEIYKEFYDNLDDNRIRELGGDLDFIQEDPNLYYLPSELEARINAAKFMSKGLNYTQEFFNTLRQNENQYGYNMRDLLHMYNDENLEKIFNIGNTLKFLNGGEINIIPDGALHKNLHHMEDAEHLTKKGIPVVAIDNNELVAEIEKSEIILRLELTEKLEELCKLYYSEDATKKEKDEYALEAGLMLVDEILNNTIDNTNKLL